MRVWIVRTLVVSALAWFGACVIEDNGAAGGTDGSCNPSLCSNNAHCAEGECVCDTNYVGDPYAANGCTRIGNGAACATTCGLNAFCDESLGACICANDFVAVCGTGDCIPASQLCDGENDCVNRADEDPGQCEVSAASTWQVWDACDDGANIEFRLFADGRSWVWPSASEAFVTTALDAEVYQTIGCVAGELVCLGASAGELSWGVGAAGLESCEDCCFMCEDGLVEFGAMGC